MRTEPWRGVITVNLCGLEKRLAVGTALARTGVEEGYHSCAKKPDRPAGIRRRTHTLSVWILGSGDISFATVAAAPAWLKVPLSD